VSSTARGGVRSENDWYETQPEDAGPAIAVISRLLPKRPLRIVEPTAGRGAIVKVLRFAFHDARIHANELDPERASVLKAAGADSVTNMDVFKPDALLESRIRWDLAFTNPPFVVAQRVVERCLAVADHVVVLQRINFLASLERLPFWQSHPADFHILPRRPSFAASLGCGRMNGKQKNPCGWKRIQYIDDSRPSNCPECQAKVLCSTTDSCEYAWFHFYEGSLRQYGHIGGLVEDDGQSILKGVT
jgi:hypothetical protein